MPAYRALQVVLLCTVVAALVLTAIGLFGLPMASEPGTKAKGDKEKTVAEQQFKYGFRYDPMKFVEEGGGIQAALVRTVVFNQPKPGDAKLIEAHFAEVFATQNEGGSFEDEHERPPLAATAGKLRELLQKGCSPDRPEMQRAIAFVERALAELPETDWPEAPGDAVHVMCLLGKTDHPAVKVRLEALAEKMPDLWGRGCPGTPFAQLVDLWVGRDIADVGDAIESTLAWADDAVAAPGCSSTLALCSSWSMIEVLGEIEHPTVARLARRLVPMLLRAQQGDGHWREGHGGDRTFFVLRMLAVHGLLDGLCDLPPLPADWTIVRALPAPGSFPQNICAFDGRLWVLDMGGPAIIEISPEDGRVLNRLAIEPIPGLHHMTLAAGDGVFYVSAFGQKDVRTDTIHEIDAATGKSVRQFPMPRTTDITGATRVGRRLFACDGWGGGVWIVDLDDPEAEPYQTYACVAAGMPDYLTSDGETIWAVDFMAPSLVKSTPDGQMLDWAERPFGFQPLAWDGQDLWAFDKANRRICIIEKANATEWQPPAPTAPYIREWLVCGPFPSEPLPADELARIAKERPDDPQVEHLRAGHDIDYLEAAGGEAAVQPTEGQTVARPDGTTVRWHKYKSDLEAIALAKVFPDQGAPGYVVYADTIIPCETPVEAHLAMGYIGSVKVRVNGQLVHDEHLARCAPRETVLIPVTFKAGENRVRVKLENDVGGGAFILRAFTLDPRTLERRALTPAAP